MIATIGSLFSGIGGLELGLERAGLGPVLWQAEIDPYCRAVLARHWPRARRFERVQEVTGESAARVGVVCGGFPCQPVSTAGDRRGADDERWLWPEYARIVAELRPAIVVAENVLGLRTLGLRSVLGDLADLGFDAEWACLSAADVGAPHLRRRLFLAATHPERIELREQPGWLGRACRSGAAVARDHGASRAAADAAGARHAWADRGRTQGRARPLQRPRRASSSSVSVAANADGPREPQPPWALAEKRGWARDSGWRHAPPAVRRVDDGPADGLDGGEDDGGHGGCEAGDGAIEAPDAWRIGALGNAVVAQCAEVIGRAIVSAMAPARAAAEGS